MSELDTRTAPSRGRSSTRGARGGFSRGGARPAASRSTNGTSKDTVQFEESLEDQGELGDMKKKYHDQLTLIKDIFPDWTDVDLLFALAESDGDVETTIERVADGSVSQFSDVKKKTKDRSASKAKDISATAGADQSTTAVRGGRGRGGFESARGGRGGRGTDRGRGGFRGARGGHAAADGIAKDTAAVSIPTTESTAWDTTAPAETAAPTGAWDTPAPAAPAQSTPAWDTPAPVSAEPPKDQGAWGSVVASESTPAAASEGTKSSLIPDGGAKKSWASMFAKPKLAPIPAVPKKAVVPGPLPAELAKPDQAPVEAETAPAVEAAQEPEAAAAAALSPPTIEEPAAPVPEPAAPIADIVDTPSKPTESAFEASSLAPSHAPLTEDNLENLPDSSHPPATLTAASTAGSMDPRGVTPLGPSQQAPIGRPTGGFQASAYRAAATPGRSASYQRRVLEQQEAVVMPGHNAVDRAAVQFGSLGLNGDAVNLDVDDEREEAETRTQPPQQSPPSQPRASLPPATRQPEAGLPESLSTPKQAPGLPPPTHQPQQDMSSISSFPQESSQPSQAYSQYARYGQSGLQQESTAQAQKPFDPFSHQAPATSAFDQYASQPSTQQHQQPFNAFSSAPSDYSQYYTADQQRNAYQNYYGASYGQQNAQGQDNSSVQQRSSSGFGSAPGESAFSSTQAPQQSQPRYADAQGSGHNTPQPSMSAAPQQMHNQQYAPQYGHPNFISPYHAAYQNQFGFSGYGPSYGGSAYGPSYGGSGGGAPAKSGGMYAAQPQQQSQQYGMNPQSSFDSTPATAGFGQSSIQSRDSALGSGLGDYGRTSAQPSQQLSSGGFGGMSEPFGRAQSGFQGQSQGYGQQQSMQQSGAADDLKPFGDSKAGGPSPALGQPGRPGSATNSAGGQAAPSSALPPPQSQQQAFGAYPGFGGQSSQYGLGGLGGSQQGGYGGYSGGGFGGQGGYANANTYGQYNRGGGASGNGNAGWGGNYSH